MEREEVKHVIHATLAVFRSIAKKTRTPADDLMVGILQANEERLVEAVVALLAQSTETPTPEQVALALDQVGIRV